MAHRFFRLREAEEMLPLLETLLTNAIDSRHKAETLEAEFTQMRQRILLHGGLLVDTASIAELKQRREDSVRQLRDALEQIESSGCLVKDLDTGLVDFPCLVDQQEIYLCWKLGEPHIGFWHRTDEGFAGRKPIDREIAGGDEPGDRPN